MGWKVLLSLVVLGASVATAAPNAIVYRGFLTQVNGVPHATQSGTISVTAAAYLTEAGAAPIWGPFTFPTVDLDGGLFSVVLDGALAEGDFGGAPTTLDVFLYDQGEVWLEIGVNGTTLTPRQQVVSVPYALVARDAERLGGLTAGDLALADEVATADHQHDASDITGGTFGGALDFDSHPTSNVRLQTSAGPPVTCDASQVGFIYLDTSLGSVQVCLGSEWGGLSGGGPGGSGGDDIPAGLAFTSLNSQPTNTLVESNVALLTDHGGVNVSIVGQGSPQFRTCADPACNLELTPFSNTTRLLSPNQYVQLRASTPATLTTTHIITVQAGGANTNWNLTTAAGGCSAGSSCIFVTEFTYQGDLGGLAGADALCTADPNNLGGPAYALLATNGYNHMRDLVIQYPVRRASDGAVIATNATQFFCHQDGCGDWAVPLETDKPPAWTGVVYIYPDGTPWNLSPPTANCVNWTSSSSDDKANHGSPFSINKPMPWMSGTFSNAQNCSYQRPIICVTNVL